MASAIYLENYLESESSGVQLALALCQMVAVLCVCVGVCVGIENLPQELRRNFALMRELDQRTEGWMCNLARFRCQEMLWPHPLC